MDNKTRWTAVSLMVAAVLAVGVAHAGGGRHGEMLKQADTNGDGQTTLAEAQAKVLEKAIGIDADKDGAISAGELQAHRERMRAERQAAHLQRMDANKDGKVSVEEFAAVHSERVARFDRNGDGVLDANDHRRHHGDQHH